MQLSYINNLTGFSVFWTLGAQRQGFILIPVARVNFGNHPVPPKT
jgi:hypothetical protein